MLSANQHHLVKLIFISSLMVLVQINYADNKKKRSVSINFPFVSDNLELNQKLDRTLVKKFTDEGYEVSNKADVELLFTTTILSDSDEIVVSIVYMRALPKEVLEFNIKNETFYVWQKDKEKLPKDGKFVREMITEEMLQNYRTASGYDTIVMKENEFENEVSKLISKAKSRIEFLTAKQ
jgi:hypothetical protein